jgi:hypothetical protein
MDVKFYMTAYGLRIGDVAVFENLQAITTAE